MDCRKPLNIGSWYICQNIWSRQDFTLFQFLMVDPVALWRGGKVKDPHAKQKGFMNFFRQRHLLRKII